MIKIVPIEDKYLDHAADLFSRVYADEEGPYDPKMAYKRIVDNLKTGLSYSFVAISDNKPVGEIINKVFWAEDGWNLWVDSLQVEPEYQKQGIAKELFKSARDRALKDGATGIVMIVDISKQFPKDWYEKMGLEKTSWVTYDAKIGDVKI